MSLLIVTLLAYSDEPTFGSFYILLAERDALFPARHGETSGEIAGTEFIEARP
jgi:hypothetical protein